MVKTYFHNYKSDIVSTGIKRIIPAQRIDQNEIVDINKLLNRIKIEKKNDTKQKFFFYCITTLVLSIFIYVLV